MTRSAAARLAGQADDQPPPAGWNVEDDGLMVGDEENGEDEFDKLDDEETDDEEEQDAGGPVFEAAATKPSDERDNWPQSNPSACSCGKLCVYIMIAVVATVAGFLAASPAVSREVVYSQADRVYHYFTSMRGNDPWTRFDSQFKSVFKPKYQNVIPASAFPVLRIGVKDVLESMDKRDDELDDKFAPAVIMLIGKRNDRFENFVTDFEQLIVNSLNEGPMDRIKVKFEMLTNDITARFEQAFEEKNKHYISIEGIENLNSRSFIHLHRYTDHETSHYRKAVIILIGYTNDVASIHLKSSTRDMDIFASNFLIDTFIKLLPQDQIEPMIARLTPSVVVVPDV